MQGQNYGLGNNDDNHQYDDCKEKNEVLEDHKIGMRSPKD
jgi:hypothetical protein